MRFKTKQRGVGNSCVFFIIYASSTKRGNLIQLGLSKTDRAPAKKSDYEIGTRKNASNQSAIFLKKILNKVNKTKDVK